MVVGLRGWWLCPPVRWPAGQIVVGVPSKLVRRKPLQPSVSVVLTAVMTLN
jgi:hypothetical protein